MIAREQLERDLRALAATVEWPPTPELAAPVHARVASDAGAPTAPAAPRLLDRLRPRSPLAIVASVLLVLLVATALVPPARSAILRVLGLTSGARIVPAPPRPPTVSRSPVDLGRTTTLAAAQRRVSFRIRGAAALGPPRRVRLSTRLAGGAVTLSWPGYVLTEFEGNGTPYVEKLVQTGTRLRRVRIGGATGYWLSGAPHFLILRDRNGAVIEGTTALVRAHVLLWDAGGLALRLETRRGLAQALAVARSVGR